MLIILDWFFVIFHMAIVALNLFGWIWPKTRRLNLISLALTALSWFGLGLFYRIGYCPLTDWHWQIKEKLGVQNLPDSYVKYYVDTVFNTHSNALSVDRFVFISFGVALLCALYVNFRKRS